eukprot:161440_1
MSAVELVTPNETPRPSPLQPKSRLANKFGKVSPLRVSSAEKSSGGAFVRRRFDTLTTAVFPKFKNLDDTDKKFSFGSRKDTSTKKSSGIKQPDPNKPPVPGPLLEDLIKTHEVVSNLWLQVALYFNLYYSIMWAVLNLLVWQHKYPRYTGLRVKYLTPIFYTCWLVVEILRIWLGYAGNLREKVPHLAAFFFLTIFPQSILVAYFVAVQYPLFPVDQITGYILAAFLVVELCVGYRAVGVIIHAQTVRFAIEFGGGGGAESAPSSQPERTDEVPISSAMFVGQMKRPLQGSRQGSGAISHVAGNILQSTGFSRATTSPMIRHRS